MTIIISLLVCFHCEIIESGQSRNNIFNKYISQTRLLWRVNGYTGHRNPYQSFLYTIRLHGKFYSVTAITWPCTVLCKQCAMHIYEEFATVLMLMRTQQQSSRLESLANISFFVSSGSHETSPSGSERQHTELKTILASCSGFMEKTCPEKIHFHGINNQQTFMYKWLLFYFKF